jgi:HEPN domain-containing protein
MPSRYEDWMRQALRDLEHARRSLEDGDYEWACFAAQQSAEKAVKALYLRQNADAWGHSVSALLQALPGSGRVDQAILDAGKELDRHYIPPRYPNSYPQGAPYEFYTRAEAERAVGHTAAILTFCQGLLAGSEPDSELSEGEGAGDGSESPGG